MTAVTTAEDGRALLPRRHAQLAAAAAVTEAPPPADAPGAPSAPVTGREADLPVDLERLADLVADRVSHAARTGRHPLARYTSFADYYAQVQAGTADPLELAIADQVTGDNPGVIPPAWVQEVKGIVDSGARSVAAFGGPEALPDAGMSVSFPYFDGDLATLVGEQATQKTDVTSVKVSLKKGDIPLRTFAGGSDVSWQLLLRSSPSYRDAYLRILAAAYGLVIGKAFTAALLADGVAGPAFDVTALTAQKAREALLAASAQVDDATGSPATAVLAASDVWLKLGSLDGVYPAGYGTSNATGQADAAGLRVEVSGLLITREPSLPAGTAIVSNGVAARWAGPATPAAVSADNVLKLGTDVAVWGMGAAMTYIPAGIVKLVDATP